MMAQTTHVYTTQLDGTKFGIAIDKKLNCARLIVLDEEFTANIVRHHRDCKVTLVAVLCCPEKEPNEDETIDSASDGGGFKVNSWNCP